MAEASEPKAKARRRAVRFEEKAEYLDFAETLAERQGLSLASYTKAALRYYINHVQPTIPESNTLPPKDGKDNNHRF